MQHSSKHILQLFYSTILKHHTGYLDNKDVLYFLHSIVTNSFLDFCLTVCNEGETRNDWGMQCVRRTFFNSPKYVHSVELTKNQNPN